MDKNIYQIDIAKLEEHLDTSFTKGLSENTVKQRIKKDGLNKITSTSRRSAFIIFIEQFKNLLIVLLIVACGFSLYLGSYRDATVLFVIIALNATVGFYQDWKAENLLSSIASLIKENCIVIREGIRKEIPVQLLVQGDIIVLEEGDGVPADIRLIESTGFETNEYILTGESQPKGKKALVKIEEETRVADIKNCVFMGTTIAKGEARGVVFATGMRTELGKIAQKSIEIKQEASPLQKEMNTLAFKITIATFTLAIILFLVKYLYHESVSNAIIFSIGVAAAMVPSGLPTQITIALSMGVERLAKRNAIIKKISSVEALGASTVIASDKTGTMTKNEMTITDCYFEGGRYQITGYGFEPKGEILDQENHVLKKESLGDKKIFFISGYLASTSSINPPDEFHKLWYPIGDPTESAFATLAMKMGFNLDKLDDEYPKIQLFPFDSVRKRVSIIREHKGKYISFVKGSIESLLEISPYLNANGKIKPLEKEYKEHLLKLSVDYAEKGLRVIAISYKDLSAGKKNYPIDEAESELIFSGFVCMLDPPHEELPEAIQAAFNARIRVLMITGDNEVTASAIAKQIGLLNDDGTSPEIINESILKNINKNELLKKLKERCLIFSRVSPDEKLRIVKLLKEDGDVVAVTGDGVNDTLSLKKSDIGIAMGLRGSKIAQEAASMVLLDDNFSTIVYAIKEGRTIYKNIQKNVMATLATNISELICILVGFIFVLFGYSAVLLPIQVLLIDLVAENIPLLTLSFDPPVKGIMHEYPRKSGQMVNLKLLIPVFFSGIVRGAIAIAAFLLVFNRNEGNPAQQDLAMTTAFITIILTQYVNIFSIRTKKTMFSSYTFNNKYLWAGILISMFILALIAYVPLLNRFLHTAPLMLSDLIYPFAGTLIYLGISEFLKLVKARIIQFY